MKPQKASQIDIKEIQPTTKSKIHRFLSRRETEDYCWTNHSIAGEHRSQPIPTNQQKSPGNDAVFTEKTNRRWLLRPVGGKELVPRVNPLLFKVSYGTSYQFLGVLPHRDLALYQNPNPNPNTQKFRSETNNKILDKRSGELESYFFYEREGYIDGGERLVTLIPNLYDKFVVIWASCCGCWTQLNEGNRTDLTRSNLGRNDLS
ncbi:hypothetical protein PanWU01x14_288040 [Parasponia andersonii]|uniref:Uncharacterized protein n=1 Tax=Parasponia andersonii TaxID=3476 RepID=A0A2P5AYL0_PARAD|nr:hypothetical protein PanWU01x14_288040 [Parasponia andersonii]